jgi:hypothetical protein
LLTIRPKKAARRTVAWSCVGPTATLVASQLQITPRGVE